MRIIHLTTDEKFIDGAHALFNSAFPEQNQFVVVVSPGNPPIKYIRQAPIFKKIVDSPSVVQELRTSIESADWVVLHGMDLRWAKLLLAEENPDRFLYIVWGAEVYENPFLYQESIHGPLTAKVRDKLALRERLNPISQLRKIYHWMFYPQLLEAQKGGRIVQKAFRKLRRIGIVLQEEFELYQRLDIISSEAEYQKLAYYPIEYFTKQIDVSIEPGDNILVGNSSSLSNNHLEVIEELARKTIGERKVIVPLSYGPTQVAAEVISRGRGMLGDNFHAITSFLPLQEYTALIQSCGLVIMNHYRQQAVGNILTAVYLGAKVYLHPKNTVLSYLRRIGCIVFDFTQDFSEPDALVKLSPDQIQHNRSCLKEDVSSTKLARALRRGMSLKQADIND